MIAYFACTHHILISKKVHEINIDQLIWVSCVHEISHNKSNHQAHILHLMVRVCIFLLLPGGLPPQKKAPTSIYKFIHNGLFPIVFLHIWLVPDVFFWCSKPMFHRSLFYDKSSRMQAKKLEQRRGVMRRCQVQPLRSLQMMQKLLRWLD